MSHDSNSLEIERFQWVGKKVGFYGSIFIIALVSVFPILWMFITSLKQPGNIVTFPVEYIPRDPTLANYRAAFEGAPFFRYMLNSAIVATGTAILSVFLGRWLAMRSRGFDSGSSSRCSCSSSGRQCFRLSPG